MQKITPFFWFDDQAEDAVNFYTSIFKKSKVLHVSRYDEASAKASGRQKGTVMTISFQLQGQDFAAINGGPVFTFNEAISMVINCDSQEEVDYYREKLTKDGDETAQQCGRLKDKYGVSRQVVPTILNELLQSDNSRKAQKVMKAMLQMKKIDIALLKKAFNER